MAEEQYAGEDGFALLMLDLESYEDFDLYKTIHFIHKQMKSQGIVNQPKIINLSFDKNKSLCISGRNNKSTENEDISIDSSAGPQQYQLDYQMQKPAMKQDFI